MHPLLDSIRTLPPGYQEFLDVAIPEIPERPTDVNDAQKDCGQLAKFLLAFFAQYTGLHLLKVPYMMGQGNEAVLGLLLASLEVANVKTSQIIMITPTSGGIYTGGLPDIACQADGATSVTISTESNDIELDQDPEHPELWGASYELTEPGFYRWYVSGEFPDGKSAPLTIYFEVTA